ncbi:uncharacterized protein dynlt4 [Chanos chanos]|uniref:Uncharacterized protein dynlt4 n=1 Tax=Chanos chanos TaxID=29144 RepID=A0A6J2VGN8_CHACN|nr:uncharacterized protein LOC115812115 [Chanos chanos]
MLNGKYYSLVKARRQGGKIADTAQLLLTRPGLRAEDRSPLDPGDGVGMGWVAEAVPACVRPKPLSVRSSNHAPDSTTPLTSVPTLGLPAWGGFLWALDAERSSALRLSDTDTQLAECVLCRAEYITHCPLGRSGTSSSIPTEFLTSLRRLPATERRRKLCGFSSALCEVHLHGVSSLLAEQTWAGSLTMTTEPLPLSEETLAQFNRSLATETGGASYTRRRLGSISTHRSFKEQSKEQYHPRHPPFLLKGITGALSESSPLSPTVSNPNSPFHRKESVFLGKRFSFGGWQHAGPVSFSGLPLLQPVKEVRLENTYRLGPDPGCCLNASRAQQILQATLDSYLNGACYNPATCSQLSQILADLVRNKVKDISPPRYKVVCQVVMGQKAKQGIKIASRTLLNPDTDNYVTAVFQNHSIFAVAIVHTLYFE